MALVLTVSQLREMAEGGTPEAFKAKVTKVYAPRKGTNGQGNPYHLQKIEISDSTGAIECMLTDRPEMSRSMEGRQIYVMAGRGQRGLTGLKRKESEYPKGKFTPQVWIYDSADVTFEGGGSDAPQRESAPPQQQQQEATPQRQTTGRNGNGNGHAHSAPAGDPHSDNGSTEATKEEKVRAEIKRFNVRLGKACAALNRCYDAAVQLTKDVQTRHPDMKLQFSTTDIKEIAMGLLTNACWTDKPSDNVDFPVKPFQSYEASTNGNHTPPVERRQGAPFN